MMTKTLIALFILFNVANAVLPGTWPQVDKPVAAVAAWNSLVDMSKVTNAPRLNQFTSCAQTLDFCRYPCGCRRADDIFNCPTKKDWSLTFDDGPSLFTPGLVDFLNAQNVKATFFVVGSRVYEYPEILKKIHDSGHDIGVHTWSHAALTNLSNEQIIAEIKYTELAIQKAINVTTRTIRPPYGECDDRVRDIIKQLGYRMVGWDRDASDFLSNSDPTYDVNWIPGNFTQWTTEASTTGHISLEHDLYQKTSLAAQSVVPVLKKAKYNIVPPATCNKISLYADSVVAPPSTNPSDTTTSGGPSNTTSNATSNNITSNDNASNTTSTTSSTDAAAAATSTNDPQSGSSQSNAVSLDKSIASLLTTSLMVLVLFYQTSL